MRVDPFRPWNRTLTGLLEADLALIRQGDTPGDTERRAHASVDVHPGRAPARPACASAAFAATVNGSSENLTCRARASGRC